MKNSRFWQKKNEQQITTSNKSGLQMAKFSLGRMMELRL